MTERILVAGCGNVLLSDDGFGVEVVRRLAEDDPPTDVRLFDAGIRGLHLAYEMTEYGYVILVDALSLGDPPGTLVVLEPDEARGAAVPDAHSMHPRAVLDLVAAITDTPPECVIVGCEPESLAEGHGLTAPVEAAIPNAIQLVRGMIAKRVQHDPAEPTKEGTP